MSNNYKKFKTNCSCYEKSLGKKYVCYRCKLTCCEDAKIMFCVCLFSYQCDIHHHNKGQICYGSHS